jgi:hypothetical protein
MTIASIIFAGVLSLGAANAVAQNANNSYRGTKSEQEACTPDVYKFCEAAIPDEKRIVACLKANVWKLSAACRRVFRRR